MAAPRLSHSHGSGHPATDAKRSRLINFASHPSNGLITPAGSNPIRTRRLVCGILLLILTVGLLASNSFEAEANNTPCDEYVKDSICAGGFTA